MRDCFLQLRLYGEPLKGKPGPAHTCLVGHCCCNAKLTIFVLNPEAFTRFRDASIIRSKFPTFPQSDVTFLVRFQPISLSITYKVLSPRAVMLCHKHAYLMTIALPKIPSMMLYFVDASLKLQVILRKDLYCQAQQGCTYFVGCLLVVLR